MQATAAATFLLLLNWALQRWQFGKQSSRNYDRFAAAEQLATAEGGSLHRLQRLPSSSSITSVKTALNATTERIWVVSTEIFSTRELALAHIPHHRLHMLLAGFIRQAGVEIGLWAFLANACTVTGFQNTAASRGAFLIRLSAILTPLVASLAGQGSAIHLSVPDARSTGPFSSILICTKTYGQQQHGAPLLLPL